MQIVAVPLFNREMVVEAYIFRYMKENNLFSTAQALNVFDGATYLDAFETLNMIGLEAFTLGKPLFIPINDLMLLGDLSSQCQEPPEKIIFVFEKTPNQEDVYLEKIRELCEKGFRFAANFQINPMKDGKILPFLSFVFLSQRPERISQSEGMLELIRTKYTNLTSIATHIYSEDVLQSLYKKSYALYESRFYRISSSDAEVSPLKVNAIRLINEVQDENFEFDGVAKIVRGDPALTISLLQMVNAPGYGTRNKIKTINQAVAMLGQQEVRKWVTTAVTRSLGEDKPSEVTRMSLIRAKFSENLAPLYEMAHMSNELFLMGLFSLLDVMLGQTMDAALDMVYVSDTIRSALLEEKGIFAPLLQMVTDYGNANWSSVSRHLIVHNISEDDLSKAYFDALTWYRNLIMQEVH